MKSAVLAAHLRGHARYLLHPLWTSKAALPTAGMGRTKGNV